MENVSPFKKLEEVYSDHGTYLELFGGSLVSSILIILVVFVIVSYYMVQLYMNELRQNWDTIKCHPGVIPFAGQIKPQPDMTPTEFTGANFTYCLTGILTQVVNTFLTPIYKMQDAIMGVFSIVLKAYTLVRKVFDRIRSVWADMFTFIMTKLTAIIIPFQKMLIRIKDTLEKTGAIMGTFLYIIMGLNWAFDAYMKTFIKQAVVALAVAAIAIVALWILPFTWPLAIAGTLTWVLMLAAVVLVYGFIRKITDMTSVQMPTKPGRPKPPIWNPFCFHPDTLIKMNDGKSKKMKDIKIGDVLNHDVEVTSTMFIKGQSDNPFYSIHSDILNDDILVTGTHKIYDEDTKSFIYVKDFKKAKPTIFWGPTMSCLITHNNTIPIGEYIFKDWED